jgi:hypothetical protein
MSASFEPQVTANSTVGSAPRLRAWVKPVLECVRLIDAAGGPSGSIDNNNGSS